MNYINNALLSRKLKIDKTFKPSHEEDGDELYPNGIFIFNITKLLEFIKINPQLFTLEAVSVKEFRLFISDNLNETTIQTANIAKPIILAEIAPERFNVIDGNHRLEKAHRDGVITIFAYKVLAEQHIQFLTSTKAYENYIEYWNSKLLL